MQVTTHTLYKNFTEDVKATEYITDSKARHQEVKEFASESNLLWPPHTQSRKDAISPGNWAHCLFRQQHIAAGWISLR
jgi:hypothetical protein